jgi:hypothetical protein
VKINMGIKVSALGNHKDCARFNEDGMESAKRKNPDRPVSLMSLAARQGVDSAELRGLCYNRFQADITIECTQMPAKGTLIKAGELTLGILPEGKACWPECKLFQENLPCPLIDGVRYAWVETPGTLCLGEVFEVVESETSDNDI